MLIGERLRVWYFVMAQGWMLRRIERDERETNSRGECWSVSWQLAMRLTGWAGPGEGGSVPSWL